MRVITNNFIVVCLLIGPILSVQVTDVNDGNLVSLITEKENVIVLFTKSNCAICEDYETILENIQDTLKDQLGAVVVKAVNSHMAGIYNPSKEPALVYFRRGIPVLYHGDVKEEQIVQTFNNNRDPAVIELNDYTFEHLTQAATGATTGDWFVFFYSIDCVICQRLYAVWEAVGAALKYKMNVARINRLETGAGTAKRFKVKESPEFLLLRQGKYYRYRQKDYTPKSFIEFAQNINSQKVKPDNVPAVASPLEEYVNDVLEIIVSNQGLLLYAVVGITLLAIFVILVKSFLHKKPKNKNESAKKSE